MLGKVFLKRWFDYCAETDHWLYIFAISYDFSLTIVTGNRSGTVDYKSQRMSSLKFIRSHWLLPLVVSKYDFHNLSSWSTCCQFYYYYYVQTDAYKISDKSSFKYSEYYNINRNIITMKNFQYTIQYLNEVEWTSGFGRYFPIRFGASRLLETLFFYYFISYNKSLTFIPKSYFFVFPSLPENIFSVCSKMR